MRYRSLGSSGLLVSVVGLGCNNFGRSQLPATAVWYSARTLLPNMAE